MKEFLFAVNATAPICLIVLIGYFLKRIGWIPLSLATSLNKLVFRLFLPAMLFLNVYKIENFSGIDFTFVWYAIGATLALFVLGLVLVLVLRLIELVLLQNALLVLLHLFGLVLVNKKRFQKLLQLKLLWLTMRPT